MKKARKHIALAALLLCMASASAQVFIVTDEEFENLHRTIKSNGLIVPYQGGDLDQTLYTPVGSGIALLAALGGAYLIGKRKKDNN